MPNTLIYDKVGKSQFFRELVEIFYSKIEKDPILRPLFPDNLEDGKYFQFLFLQQFFGGPKDYEKIRGRPMLKKRHLPFVIGIKERNRWVALIHETIKELKVTEDIEKTLMNYFELTATKMMNKDVLFDMKNLNNDSMITKL